MRHTRGARPGRDAEILDGDDLLLGRLRQLGLIELEALTFGTAAELRGELVAAYADDLADALARARQRMAELVASIASGPDPLQLASAPPEVRARGGAGEAAGRLAARLGERADACRRLARLDDACALLLPRLVDIDRKRAAGQREG
jgi:hypothetical protein